MLAMAWLVATDGPIVALVAAGHPGHLQLDLLLPGDRCLHHEPVRDERELGPANSLWATLDNLGYIIGPALGGLLVALGGASSPSSPTRRPSS